MSPGRASVSAVLGFGIEFGEIGSMILLAVKLRAWFHPGPNLKPVRIVRHCRELKVSPLHVGIPQIQPQSFKKGLFTCKCSLLQISPPIFLELPVICSFVHLCTCSQIFCKSFKPIQKAESSQKHAFIHPPRPCSL